MKAYKWRTQNSGYVYVDSNTGSDVFGNGTMQNPYQTLGKAWRGHTTYHPGTIVCRGTFCEDMADGTHSTNIYGDYWGAATFDGNNEYTCYGFASQNMMFRNCVAGTANTSANSNPLLAGVGRAVVANTVGNANNVDGVAAPSVALKDCAVYMGGIGGSTAARFVSICRPQCNDSYKLWFASYENCKVYNFSVYDIPREKRVAFQSGTWGIQATYWVLGKVAMLLQQNATFINCYFCSDCEWWDGDTKLDVQGETSAEKQAWIENYIKEKGYTSNLTKFTDCVFSDRTSYEVFNDPDNGDLSLRYDNLDERLMLADNTYMGALPPAIHIPVMSDSSATPATWDEHTAVGLLAVSNDSIVLNEASGSDMGQIYSKVLVTNPDKVAISGIFSQYASMFEDYGIVAGADYPEGERYELTDEIPEGRYFIRGGSIYVSGQFAAKDTVVVVTSGQEFVKANDDEEPYLIEILDGNVIDFLYLRSCPTAYAYIKASDGLQAGGTYINVYNKPITYRGRTIVQNESFIAENDTDTFECADDAEYRIAVLFDDTRVPSQPWVQAQFWGDYFEGKIAGVRQTDSDGNVISSGNYLAWQSTGNGGYSGKYIKANAQARYIQLKIEVKNA
jgi:hypothetical protein